MKARGATVPWSAGWVDMYRKRERSAEKRVVGDDGMGATVVWPVAGVVSGMEPDVDPLRSGFRRTGTSGSSGWDASASEDDREREESVD